MYHSHTKRLIPRDHRLWGKDHTLWGKDHRLEFILTKSCAFAFIGPHSGTNFPSLRAYCFKHRLPCSFGCINRTSFPLGLLGASLINIALFVSPYKFTDAIHEYNTILLKIFLCNIFRELTKVWSGSFTQTKLKLLLVIFSRPLSMFV